MNDRSTPDAGSIPAASDPYAGHEPSASYSGDHEADDNAEAPDLAGQFIDNDLDPDEVPDDPADYAIARSGNAEIDAHLAALVENDSPILDWWAERGRQLGLSQAEWNQLTQEFVAQQLPDLDSQLERLGPNGQQRLERAERWAAENMPPDLQEALGRRYIDADLIKLIEFAAEQSGSPLTAGEPGANAAQARDLHAEVKRVQNSAAYRRGDKAAVAKVRNGYRQLAQLRARGAMS